jgi:hypothetical protein
MDLAVCLDRWGFCEPVDFIHEAGNFLDFVDHHNFRGLGMKNFPQPGGLLLKGNKHVMVQQIDPEGVRILLPEQGRFPCFARPPQKSGPAFRQFQVLDAGYGVIDGHAKWNMTTFNQSQVIRDNLD